MPDVIAQWQHVASHDASTFLGWGELLFAHLPPFNGDLANRIDRVNYGWSTMYPNNITLTILYPR